jgi:uncharacterized membrane protein YebE (DUF533 family)
MEEQVNVCKALAAMVSDHGDPDQEEITFVARASLELGIDNDGHAAVQEVLTEGGDFDELVTTIESPHLRRFLFRNVVTAALLDDHINEDEHFFIERTRKAYGFDEAATNEFIAWVAAGIAHEKQGRDLMDKL